MASLPELNRMCFLSNYNLYESKRYFTDHFAAALNRKGVQTMIIDVEQMSLDKEMIASILKFKPDLTCSFNSILPLSEDFFLWDYLKLPHWAILVDPLVYNLHLMKSPYLIASCTDRQDCEAMYQPYTRAPFFFAHAVERELNGQGASNRDLDIVFLGSCYDYENLRATWRENNMEEINKLLDDAIDIVLSDISSSIAQALVQACQNSNIALTPELDFFTLFSYLDYYTRGKDRVELIKSLKHGRVHVFGDTSEDLGMAAKGWGEYLAGHKNVTIHPAVSFGRGLEILKRSKIALNSMPFFKNGTHERVFTALGCGALPLTMNNLYWQEQFIHEQDLLSYLPGHWEKSSELVETYLDNEPLRQELVSAGVTKVQKQHTWDQRAEQVLQALPPLLSQIDSHENTF